MTITYPNRSPFNTTTISIPAPVTTTITLTININFTMSTTLQLLRFSLCLILFLSPLPLPRRQGDPVMTNQSYSHIGLKTGLLLSAAKVQSWSVLMSKMPILVSPRLTCYDQA